jgi:uncharacterized protein (TIGR03435 family)
MPSHFLVRIAAVLMLTVVAFGQTPAPTPALAFEVASVKPAGPLDPAKIMSGQMRIGMQVDKARVDIGSLSLADLIAIAFKVKPYQISGPNWMGAERYTIQAKLPEGATPEQVPEMLQALLAERFKLTFHREKAEHGVYALVVGKNGHKLKESPKDAPKEASETTAGESPSPDASPAAAKGAITIGAGKEQVSINGRPDSKGGMVVRGGAAGNMKMTMGPDRTMHMEAEKTTMDAFSQMLSRFVDRPVVDMTDLKGFYQVAIDLNMEDMMNAAKASGAGAGMMVMHRGGGDPGKGPADLAPESSGSSIFQSVQQLGLKLEPRKTPLDRVVIDHLERTPTEN